MLLWTSLGTMLQGQQPGVALPWGTKGPRLSLMSLGRMAWRHRSLKPTLAWVQTYLPLPALNVYPWLHRPVPPQKY